MAKLQIGETKHQLRIMAYRGGGNRFFYVSNTGTFSEHVVRVVASLEDVYKTRKFKASQASDSSKLCKVDAFFVEFESPPLKAN
ncbi:hypothetical protein MMC07_008060 [Pseudocyphellaria aurata]|nr:hypothetical protein [Pseudocyphellaria aurata]